ncbi:MAG: nif-specific transcriptional activator NifA [Candidatus Omnitrophica bacterium]|nr:nif-specific transcriptional activator NifA [Candidatus Omnitrophota bacterium]
MKNKGREQKTEQESLKSLKRKISELQALYDISQSIHSSLNLETVMKNIMAILHEKMGMERGTLTLLDTHTGELSIEVAHGLDREAIGRGRYRVGEGITGKVVAAGEPMIVPNVGKEPLFLNRTKSRGDISMKNIAFLCVPIKLDQKTIGALSVDRLVYEGDPSLDEDLRLLTIISSMASQAVRIDQLREKEKEKLRDENVRLRQELKKKFHPTNIVGECKRMADIYASIELVSQTRATVMLRGASGTGKELVAHAIHYNSDRAEGPFIKISCAALPETLLESELFGYEKGAFTGAATSKKGRFEMAHRGTLFLDEIGDISLSMQVKLLRVLQEKEFERLGGTQTIRVDVRFITATNKDLEVEVKAGRFREDLYYRLNVIPIFLPTLRERKEDIPLLVNHFLRKANEVNGKSVQYISDSSMEYFLNYAWPGNVRELENAIERAVVLCPSDTLTPDLFPIPGVRKINLYDTVPSEDDDKMIAESEGLEKLPEAVEFLEKKMIKRALEKTNGNQRKAAQLLAVTERILGYKIKNYGLK